MGTSIFEIIGPVMIGPSSSHTAGMARIGMMAHRIADAEIRSVRLDLSPMLRTTYRGHRTDAALIGGTIGLSESDPEIRDSISLAHEKGIDTTVDFLPEGKHPQNTALITVSCGDGRVVTVLGTSIGGGSIVISAVDGVAMHVSPESYHVFLWSRQPLNGVIPATERPVQSGKTPEEIITCLSFSTAPQGEWIERLCKTAGVTKVSVVNPVLEYGTTLPTGKKYDSIQQICDEAAASHRSLSELAVGYEMSRSGFSRDVIRGRMMRYWEQMKESVRQGQQETHLLYGLADGKDGKRLLQIAEAGATISGGIVPLATARALCVMEYNGSMGCIVAAPTAGSSGIVPGCYVTIQEKYNLPDEKIVDALFVSGLMGVVMAHRNVSFSGSVGGCQGEVGVSSAITSSGLASLFTGKSEEIVHAMALCLKNLLGLVCDPIAGPIEIPCIKRNAVGVANAFISADMALAGIQSFIPPDEVIDALVDVEKRLPQELKCATVGGLACTKTAQRVREELYKQ